MSSKPAIRPLSNRRRHNPTEFSDNPTSVAIRRFGHPSAASNTTRARRTIRCGLLSYTLTSRKRPTTWVIASIRASGRSMGELRGSI